MNIIEPSEHLWIDSYEKMFKDSDKVIYVNTDELHKELKKEKYHIGDEQFVVVSAASDLTLSEQAVDHPNLDLVKLAAMFDWSSVTSQRDKYPLVQVGPACIISNCVPSDKYSLKTDRFTFNTIPDIPKNIKKLYITNLNVRHSRVEPLLFGLNNSGHGSSILPNYADEKKSKLLYVNMQNCTLERVHLNNHFKQCNWATFKNPNLKIEDFLEDVATHKFTLCALGNAVDSYRIWETIYLGGIAIIPRCTFSAYLESMNLPVYVTDYDRIFQLTPDELNAAWNLYQKCDVNYEPLKRSYWKQRILNDC